MNNYNEAERLIRKARYGVLADQPFWGTLGLRLVLRETNEVTHMATDGVTLLYNPDWVMQHDDLEFEQLKACCFHEFAHISLLHHHRIEGCDLRLANVAADYVVNDLAQKAGYILPEGALIDSRFSGKSLEEVYGVLLEEQGKENPEGEKKPDENGDEQAPGGGAGGGSNGGNGGDAPPSWGDIDPAGHGAILPAPKGVPEPDMPVQKPIDEVDVKQSHETAKAMGWEPGDCERMLNRAVEPRVDWVGVLHDFADSSVMSDYSWERPDRRFIQSGFYLPELGEPEPQTIVIGCDTSGSVDEDMLASFCAEINAIKLAHKSTVHVVYCDSRVQRTEEFGPEEEVTLNPKGGGGTNFAPVFKWVEEQDITPSCLVYFTDLYGSFPDKAPDYPVLWSCFVYREPDDRRVPFGQYLQMVN